MTSSALSPEVINTRRNQLHRTGFRSCTSHSWRSCARNTAGKTILPAFLGAVRFLKGVVKVQELRQRHRESQSTGKGDVLALWTGLCAMSSANVPPLRTKVETLRITRYATSTKDRIVYLLHHLDTNSERRQTIF